MAEQGWIKLHRKILEWEWFTDPNTLMVFVYLLCHAQWHDSRFMGHEVKAGQLVTGRKKIAEDLKISEQSVRTSLNHLKSTNEITINSTSQYSIITVNNWDKWQAEGQTTGQAEGKQRATDKEYKEIEEGKEVKEIKHIYGEYKHVKLTDSQRDKLFKDYGEAETLKAIKYLDEYIQMKGYKAKDHNLCLRKWVFDAIKEKPKSDNVFDAWANA